MYNQPFSQSPEMFGSQSGGAQMQSAPNLPPGNAPGREYFNHSMATFTNAMQPPPGMMPQGISSLVPAYQFGGGVGYGYSGDESVQASIDAAQADFDAAAEADAAAAADYDVGFSQADADASVAADYDVGFNQDIADANSIAQAEAEAQAAVDSLNDASRGAATQGGPPDVDFTNLALEALQTPTAAPEVPLAAIQAAMSLANRSTPQTVEYDDEATQGGLTPSRPDVDFSNLAINALQDDLDILSGGVTGSTYQGAGIPSTMPDGTIRGMSLTPFGTIYDKPTAEARGAIKDAQTFEEEGFGRFLPGAKTVTQNPYTGEVSRGYGFGLQDAIGLGLGFLNPALGLGYAGYKAGQPSQVSLNYNTGLGSLNQGDLNQGNTGMDMANVSLPERVLAVDEPDAGDPNDPNNVPDVPDASATPTAQALAPLVYQAYANLGLPVPGNVPAFRRVNIPTSRFIV